jgi:hypothetical protein
MNPFGYYAIIICLSPLAGFKVFKALGGTFLQVSIIAAVCCAILYFSFLVSGTRLLGEEGDYTLFAFLFLFFNVLIFQLLRFERNRAVYGIFVFLITISSVVVGIQSLITAAYVVTNISRNL